MTISTNFQRKIAGLEISYGRALYFFFYYYLLIKRPGSGGGVDTGSVGLVETRVFFFFLRLIETEASDRKWKKSAHLY